MNNYNGLNNYSAKQAGFTLIEIIVSLAIVAFGVVSIVDAMGKHTQATSELEARIMANWVASTHIAEIRYDAKINRIREGRSSETIKMGGNSWRSRAEIKKTDVERVYLLTVEVKDEARRDAPAFATITTAITDRL